MKKLLTIILVFFAVGACAQSASITFAPGKNGLGLILETPKVKSISLLASYDSGEYKFNGTTIEKYGGGLKYNWFMILYQHTELDGIYKNETKFHKHSFEIGGDVELNKRIYSGMLYDPRNRECRLFVTVKLF